MDTSLKLYFVDNRGEQQAFPYGKQQAEVFDFTANKTRMGSIPTISATLEYPECLDGEWENLCHFDDVFVVFCGERYYLKSTPASSKTNDKLFYKHELNFVNERSVLETTYMIDDLENQTANIILSNNTNITFFGTIAEFVERINQSMYFSGIGDTCLYSGGELVPVEQRTLNNDGFYVVVDASVTNTDEVLVTLSSNTVMEAIKQILEKWGVPYYFVGRVAHIGEFEAVSNQNYAVGGVLGAGVENGSLLPYEYGKPNSVLTINRNNSTKELYNRCSGVGSSDNIPYYYPNPTPTGTIHHEVTAETGSTLTDASVNITSYLKFSGLDESDALVYSEKHNDITSDLGKKYFFFDGKAVYFITRPGYIDMKPMLQKLNYDFTSMVIQQQGVYSTRYRLLPTTVTLMVKMNIDKPFYYLRLDFSTECTSDVNWEFNSSDNSVRINGNGNVFVYDGEALPSGEYYLSIERTYTPSTTSWINEGQFNLLKTADIDISNLVDDAFYWTGKYGQDQKLWCLQSSGTSVQLSDYGISINTDLVTLVDGDKIEKIVDKWVTPQERLMPSCYRASDGKKKFYPAQNYPLSTESYTPDEYIGDEVSGTTVDNDNYKDDNNQYYTFDNPLRKLKQKEHIYEFDIKPSIEEMTNQYSQRIDMFEAFAYDTNDDNSGYYDGNGNWVFNHPYFFGQLRPTSYFNLFEQIIDEGKMSISMTSGNCAPCEFEIDVDKDTMKNLVQVDSNGDLIRDDEGDVICGRKEKVGYNQWQQDTRTHRVWVALKKDVETYGESSVMPYNKDGVTIRPKACTDYYTDDGDTFVILHIDMPVAYVEAAEQRLTKEIISQMHEDNSETFNVGLRYSMAYLGDNQSLIDILNENVKVMVKYNGVTKDFFVSSYSYHMTHTSPIPEINIGGLVETVEELKMVSSSGKSFVRRIGEHISEKFGEFMLGINKPFTQIVNRNNTVVANQIRGDFPKDYVITDDELVDNSVILGANGRYVKKLMNGRDGQVLKLKGSIPQWGDGGINGETTFLQSDQTVTSSPLEVSEFRQGLEEGLYLMNVTLDLKLVADTAITGGLVTSYIEYNKTLVCSSQTSIRTCGQLTMTFVVEITDANEPLKVYVFSDTASSGGMCVASSITNNMSPYQKSSYISVLKLK